MSAETKSTIESRIVAFRCPPVLASAMQAVANADLISVSDVARQAVLKEMRVRGLIPKKEAVVG